MNARHPLITCTALLSCALLAIPANVAGQAAQTPQHAGKITNVLPIVNVVRGAQQTPASTSEAIFWGDSINTGHLARARVALDDGSVLSVGSDSNLTVKKHDAAGQQTDLDLNYGRVRAKAVKLVKPNASFQIRTPAGVAGVVGTDFGLESEGDKTRLMVYEGRVNFCALTPTGIGACVIVGAGEASSVQFNGAPTPPVAATPVNVTEMTNATSTGAGAGAAGGGISAGAAAGIGIGAGVAAVVATVVIRAVSKTPTCSNTPAAAAHVAPSSNCQAVAGAGKMNGQRP